MVGAVTDGIWRELWDVICHCHCAPHARTEQLKDLGQKLTRQV